MKKLILIIMFAFVMILFISLNYLLWDRENKENSNAYKDASIAALGRDINNLQSTNTQLRERADRFESESKINSLKAADLQNEKDKLLLNLDQKNDIINQLKQMVDTKQFEAIILQWADYINKNQYDKAYQLQTVNAVNQQNMTPEEFANYFKNHIKNINTTGVTIYVKGQPEEKRGELAFKVSLEANLVPNTGKTVFDEGKNEKIFTLVYSKEKNAWLISGIQ